MTIVSLIVVLVVTLFLGIRIYFLEKRLDHLIERYVIPNFEQLERRVHSLELKGDTK